MSKTNVETPVANAVVLRHIKVTPKAAPGGPRGAKPEKPKQKQNNTWPLKQVLDLLTPMSPKKPSINVGGKVKLLMKQIGTTPNAKGLYRFECDDGSMVTLRKEATVTVVDDPVAIKAKATGITRIPTIEEIIREEQADAKRFANDDEDFANLIDDVTDSVPNMTLRAFTLMELVYCIFGLGILGVIGLGAITFIKFCLAYLAITG